VTAALLPSMTVVVPTYRRRDAVVRFLRVLAGELAAQPEMSAGTEVVVVVDGSRDGTVEAVEALDYPVPLRTIFQENAGLAASRNRGLDAAEGELVWLVDDDMVPTEGLLARHRLGHGGREPHFAMGPCLHPPDGADITGPIREYAERWFGALAEAGEVTKAFDFSAANTSAPRSLWLEVGGFDSSLSGWGGEDYEIGLRIMERGYPVVFDPQAIAWHHQVRTVREFCANRYEQGRNFVRIARIHPQAIDEMIPKGTAGGRALRLLHRLSAGRSRRYAVGAKALVLGAEVEARTLRGEGGHLLDLAQMASQIAGVAELDPDGSLVERYFAGTT
jgi:GT2 family glycosyltransferase